MGSAKVQTSVWLLTAGRVKHACLQNMKFRKLKTREGWGSLKVRNTPKIFKIAFSKFIFWGRDSEMCKFLSGK